MPRSVVLVSPRNQILLLHRVQTSTAFPSAHVFPGGTLSSFHDGAFPAPEDVAIHNDSEAYRLAAIRETFEETGILLARSSPSGRLIELEGSERARGRKNVHQGETPFLKWLARHGAMPDTGKRVSPAIETCVELINHCRRSDPLHSMGDSAEPAQTLHHADVLVLPPHRTGSGLINVCCASRQRRGSHTGANNGRRHRAHCSSVPTSIGMDREAEST